MKTQACILLAIGFALASCASPSSRGGLAGTRTVFHNPFATMERFEDEMRQGIVLPGSGRVAFDREGNPIRLRREERRAMRDRAAAVRSTIILREALEKGQRVPVPLDAPSRSKDGGGAPAMDPSLGALPVAVPVSLPAPSSKESR
ncbi:MAG: hypothetical protein RIB52_04390 [Erythrobacter sp.]|uniref:hypothetical protein n=1 Tax=Erythrobacter sp. TaxID=1042 RepID=UPI0032EC05AF